MLASASSAQVSEWTSERVSTFVSECTLLSQSVLLARHYKTFGADLALTLTLTLILVITPP